MAETTSLNDLPRNIVDNILERLPLREAVRTSLLSSEWRYKWLHIGSIVIDNEFVESLNPTNDLNAIISSLLLIHRGTIDRFSITCFNNPSLSDWLYSVLYHHDTTVLTIKLLDDVPPNVLLRRLFELNHRLTELSLHNIVVTPPSTYPKFNCLVKLELFSVTFDPMQFNKFVSMCPNLEFFTIYRVIDPIAETVMSVNLPASIRCFSYSGPEDLFFSFHKAVCVEEISIRYNLQRHPTLFEENSMKYLGYFNQFSAIRTMRLDSYCLELFASGTVLVKELPNQLKNLTRLHFREIDFGKDGVIQCVVCLVRSSPILESLQIDCEFMRPSEATLINKTVGYLKHIEEHSDFPICSNLKTVRIVCFSGLDDEMLFAKLLLSSTPLLQEFCVLSISRDSKEKLEELRRFSRASTQVKMAVY